LIDAGGRKAAGVLFCVRALDPAGTSDPTCRWLGRRRLRHAPERRL